MADELISTAGVFPFDPATEFQVMEEFDHDELVQRPEAIRFFTLEQQATDYIQKLLPRSGRVPKGVLKDAEHEVDTMRKLYARIVKETEEGYERIPMTRPTTLDWVTLYSDKAPGWEPYSFDRSWSPLFTESVQYTTILDALPRWSMFSGSGTPVPITRRTKIFSTATETTTPLLGPVTYTKTAFREDGTYTVQKIGRPETQDQARFVGYRVGIPPVEFPNPLDDNAFLQNRVAAGLVPSEDPLGDLIPNLELILEHAVPTTNNPSDALKYLRIWDVQLTEIPWSIWKTKFLPVETQSQAPVPVDIPIPPGQDETAPSDDLQGLYGTRWTVGQAPRHWLSRQLDGGRIVPVLLLSKAGALQPIPVPPPFPLMDPDSFAKGTPDDCLPEGVSSFEALASAGVYRPIMGGRCIPLNYIAQEQEELPYRDRKPWLPDTETQIRDTYARLLKSYRVVPERLPGGPRPVPAKRGIAQPEARGQILALLAQVDSRVGEDVSHDIRTLLRTLVPEPKVTKHVITDGTTDGFLICEHTLARLDGDFDKKREEFLKKWSAIDGGRVVCQFCGDTLSNEVLVTQDQFDAEGRPVVSYDSLESVKARFSPDHTTKAFAVSLKELRTMFDLDQPGEDIMYLLISLLQVTPEPDKLKPYLDLVKTEGAKLKAFISGKDSKKSADARLVASILGFASTIVMIQTHNPPLLPRRSVGSKPLQTKGFPRDSSDLNDSPFVDGVLTLLKRTFEDLPVTFSGSSVVFVRILIQNQKSLRTKVLATLKKLADGPFKTAIGVAKDTLRPLNVAEEPSSNAFEPPLFRFESSGDLAPSARLSTRDPILITCKDPLPAWYTGSQSVPPFVETQIVAPIVPAPTAERLPPPVVTVLLAKVPDTATVRDRIRIGLPKDFGSATYRKLSELDDASSLQRGLEIVLDTLGLLIDDVATLSRIRTEVITASGDPSLLRDTFKGLFYDLARSIDRVIANNLEKALGTSLALRGLLTSASSAKFVRDKLRAQETAQYKQRLRVMSDNEREVTKKLQDLKLGIYLVTKDDRETFMRELAKQFEDVEEPDVNAVADGEAVPEDQLPEDGLAADRDDGPQGNDEVDVNGNALEDDYGDYGDRRARATVDGEEIPDLAAFNFEEGYGV